MARRCFRIFLCIGAQKSGTTWLHHNLALHPSIFLPPTKSIHYFNLPPTTLCARLIGRTGRMRKARAHLAGTFAKVVVGQAGSAELRWALRYCLAPRNDGWYESLFRRPSSLIAGETTPAYARLSIEEVQRVHALLPNAKIIYLIRHPVERAWSDAVRHFKTRGGIGRATADNVTSWLRGSKTLHYGDYLSTILNWERVYGGNFFLGFYNELEADPESLLTRVQAFLGVPISIPVDVGTKRNPGNWTQIPEPFRGFLNELFQKALAELHVKLQSPFTQQWLSQYSTA